MRRIAVHKLILDGKEFDLQIVEFEGERMLRHYPLEQEIERTEWHPITLTINNNLIKR